MSYYDDDFEDYLPIQREAPHSGLGVTSLILAILATCGFALIMVVAIIESIDQPFGMDQKTETLLGCGALASLFLGLIGLGMGIGGCCQRHRKMLFSIIGIVLNGVLLLGILLVMLLGLVAD